MSKLRRYPTLLRPVFITAVTADRLPHLQHREDALLRSIQKYEVKYYFNVIAWVILPEHFHLVIESEVDNISGIMHRIKNSFTVDVRRGGRFLKTQIWQPRFWDHIIRDQEDLNHHIDYIHFNPVKHGHAKSPFEWRWSSIHTFAKAGTYAPDWGKVEGAFEGYGEPMSADPTNVST